MRGGWLDLTTGYAWPQSSIDDDALDDVPGPDDDPERWLELPFVGSRVAWQDMADFVDEVTDARAAADLGSAVQDSSAFSRFQRAVDKHRICAFTGASTRRSARPVASEPGSPTPATTQSRPQPPNRLPAQYPAARIASLLSTGVPVGGSVRVSVLVGSDSKFPADAFGLS
jgi:cell division septation protein DedD